MLLGKRDVPHAALVAGLGSLAPAVEARDPRAAALVREALGAIS